MEHDDIIEGIKLIEQGLSKFQSGPIDYYLKKLFKAREVLLTRFAPFKVGDRVTLSGPLVIEPNSGWNHCRHFLVPGEPATVRDSDCDLDGNFRFYIEFDNETWIDPEGKVQPVSSKHVFCFFEKQLTLLPGWQ